VHLFRRELDGTHNLEKLTVGRTARPVCLVCWFWWHWAVAGAVNICAYQHCTPSNRNAVCENNVRL
jgi:hypothetical protein